MDQLDEQIKLARMGAFEEGAAQMEEQARTAACNCNGASLFAEMVARDPSSEHKLLCPVAVWGRAAKLLRTLKATEEAKGDMPWREDGE